MEPIVGRAALTRADDGREVVPQSDDDWLDWVAATRSRNWLNEDPLLDWLDRYGVEKGFVPDDQVEGYDRRTSFREFVFAQGDAFEAGVLRVLSGQVEVVRIAATVEESRSLGTAERTVEALRSGVPIVTQGVLFDPQHRMYGMADLLIRSDILAGLFPSDVSLAEAAHDAPGLGLEGRHYRVVDIKYRTIKMVKGGSVGQGSDTVAYQSQVWVYNTALGRIQGYTPPSAYLLGRNWKQGQDRGDGCLERIGRVPMEAAFENRDGATLQELTLRAHAWVRQMRREGAGWEVLPVPSRPELYPHMRHAQDDPWHAAKAHIGAELEDLTLLPGMNPPRREQAHAKRLYRWSSQGVNGAALGLGGTTATLCDAVLAANRSDVPVVLPPHLVLDDDTWRRPAPLELFVDFETVSNMADDFLTLPLIGGQPLIFQVGCGRLEDGQWFLDPALDQWTVDRLDEASEAAMIDAWVARMQRLCAERGISLADARIYHWSPAESSNLDTAYNAARARHPDAAWPDLPWFDLLKHVVKAAPISVTGAFNFGLKAIAKAMHQHGWIETHWGDGPTDGLGAMVAAWRVEETVSKTGGRLLDDPLMQEVAAYNRVDCHVMAEILQWLRARESLANGSPRAGADDVRSLQRPLSTPQGNVV